MLFPTMAFHHDEEFFPNPDTFDPERFSEETKKTRHPFSFLPFGEGPRNCIGMRFGLMQIKVGLATLLKHFRFVICDKTKIPLDIDQEALLYIPKGGVWLKIERV